MLDCGKPQGGAQKVCEGWSMANCQAMALVHSVELVRGTRHEHDPPSGLTGRARQRESTAQHHCVGLRLVV